MIKGQEKLINTINNLENLPHSILLIGEEGSGHIEVCNYISNLFDLVIYDLTEFISNEFIDEINASNTRSLYYVNMSNIGEREQNIILKLYEEPSPYCYIILNCESEDIVIDTIKSRSYILKFEKYKKDYLKELIIKKESSELILKICNTPGQIELANYTNVEALYELCTKIWLVLKDANFQNTMSIANKINFKDEYDKFDLSLFLKTLKITLLESNITNKIKLYEVLLKCSKYIKNMNNKQIYFENMLINLWLLSRES